MGPKEIARAFEMKETAMNRRGIGFVAAGGSRINKYGEKKIVGHTEDREGVSRRVQCADAKKVLGSVHKMNVGGNVVVLDGDESYTQNKDEREDPDQPRAGPVRHVRLGAGEGGRSCEGDGEGA